jgi:hypothetical protein
LVNEIAECYVKEEEGHRQRLRQKLQFRNGQMKRQWRRRSEKSNLRVMGSTRRERCLEKKGVSMRRRRSTVHGLNKEQETDKKES